MTEQEGAGSTAPRDDTDGVQVHLIGADGKERCIGIDEVPGLRLSDDEVLWIDVLADAAGNVDDAVAVLSEGRASAAPEPTGAVSVTDADDLLRIEVVAIDGDGEPAPLACLVGDNWLVTVHRDPLDFQDDFRERMSGGSELGKLDAPTFVGTFLGWGVRSYARAVAAIALDVDQLDAELLSTDVPSDQVLARLVELRRQIGSLRRVLIPHRDVFASLASPQLDRISSSSSAEAFQQLAKEVERAAAGIDSAREMLLGSFDILMTRSAQRTNETMATLTIVTVVLLPSTLLAGIMGMNFHPAFFDHPALFWVTLGVMVAAMITTVLVLRRRLRS